MRRDHFRFDSPLRATGQRRLRVAETIRQALSHVLERGDARDPGLENVSITVTEVQLSTDLRHARVFVMPLGGSHSEELLDSLRRAAPFLRRRIGNAVTLKRLPSLQFELDSRFDTVDRIDALLRHRPVSVEPEDSPLAGSMADNKNES